MSSKPSQKLDRELDLKALIWFAVALTGVVLAMAALMWVMSAALRSRLVDLDPPRPLLPAARVQSPPPEPRLQAHPETDLVVMRQEEDELLSSFGWIDESAGLARVPIETAIELLADGAAEAPGGTTPMETDP